MGVIKTPPLTIEFQSETESLTALNAEVASLLDVTLAESGLISRVAEQIRARKLDGINLMPEELVSRLEIPQKELDLFSKKLNELLAMVACNALAAATGGWGMLGCGVAYVGVVGIARVKYENCIKK